jgi:uncharacterized protein YneR
MKTLIIIGITIGIGIILFASLSTLSEIRKQECKVDGGVMTGPFGCVTTNTDFSIPFIETPEVKAFYAKYEEDTNVSVKNNHVSYFAGSEEDLLIRMNLYFDETNEIDHIDFHCYFQKEHLVEIAQEDIVYFLDNRDCKKPEP